jgi:pyridoxine 5-phosphate synthase
MRLGVNIDHVATVRQARGAFEPDPVAAAFLCERAGANHITIHLREDRRHIQERDLAILSEVAATGIDLEMAATAEMVDIAIKYKPAFVTLVPEKREELTTEGGLDVAGQAKRLTDTITELKAADIPASTFIEPEEGQINASVKVGAEIIEIHTGAYANATGDERRRQLERIMDAARHASGAGLAVSAGHGLTYYNVVPVAAIAEIEELNIGHSIVSRAIMVGLEEAVRQMLVIMLEARQ